MPPSTSGSLVAATLVAGVLVTLLLARRRRRRVLAEYRSQVEGRPWYKTVAVTDQTALHGGGADGEVVRGLHLGAPDTIPESLVRLRWSGTEFEPVAEALLKPHIQYSLLAFAWLDEGFRGLPEGRAALVGVAGGSLLHFWRECVPGGASLDVDAVELDGAVLAAARAHLGLRSCEPPRGRVALHVKDGRDFLRDAEDESYDLLVIDLDMGALVDQPTDGAAAEAAAAGGASDRGTDDDAAARRRRLTAPRAPDPTRDMYRVLSSRGVLVVNEYSEEGPARRLESSLRLVRLLRRFFPQVHQIRTTTHHNTMLLAPAAKAMACDAAQLAERASRAARALGLGGIDAGELLRRLPPNRHQVYAHDV